MTASKTKPPIGLMPKNIWQEKRSKRLKKAIIRYVKNNKPLPNEWLVEYHENLIPSWQVR